MKKFEFKIFDNDTSRVLDATIEAKNLVEARMLIKIMYRTGDVTKLIGVPKDINGTNVNE